MSNDVLPLVAIVVMVVLAGLMRSSTRSSRRSTRRTQPKRIQHYDHQLDDFPYQLQHNFLTPSELNFFQSLRRAVGNRAVICPKVRLGDVVWVNVKDRSQAVGYSNKINRKHVDYLLCDPATMKPLVGIELDDKSHQREDRQERDAFVDGVFAAAGLPLIHVPVKRAYVVDEIAAQLAPYLKAAAVPSANGTAVKVVQPVAASTNESPYCPNCDSKMVVRTAKGGSKPGSKFWGCPNYPTCRGMLAYASS